MEDYDTDFTNMGAVEYIIRTRFIQNDVSYGTNVISYKTSYCLKTKSETDDIIYDAIKYQNENVQQALENISTFLETCDIEPATSFQINLCCEELMYNIVTYAVNKDTVSVLIKDDGEPFNPILKTVSFNEDGNGLGLALVNTIADIKYKFMYNQNVVFLTFKREQTI